MFKYLLTFFSVIVLTSCATSKKTEDRILEDKIKAQEPADRPQDIAMRAAEVFSFLAFSQFLNFKQLVK